MRHVDLPWSPTAGQPIHDPCDAVADRQHVARMEISVDELPCIGVERSGCPFDHGLPVSGVVGPTRRVDVLALGVTFELPRKIYRVSDTGDA